MNVIFYLRWYSLSKLHRNISYFFFFTSRTFVKFLLTGINPILNDINLKNDLTRFPNSKIYVDRSGRFFCKTPLFVIAVQQIDFVLTVNQNYMQFKEPPAPMFINFKKIYDLIIFSNSNFRSNTRTLNNLRYPVIPRY